MDLPIKPTKFLSEIGVNYYAWRMKGDHGALVQRPGLQDLEIERIHSSLKSLVFDIDNEDTNTSGY